MPRVIIYLDLGLRFALSAVLFALLGYWVDSKLSISPVGLIAGVLFGAVAGFINLYHNVMRLTRQESAGSRKTKSNGPQTTR
ncbi:MAG: AtpZ/AtpI family protein [candidate division KSB1 bacterium]|nr:AtpZ/AtpI family protein [candidate division KSB1 bacterium]MDZ7273049.1 AtpZ/AtpI family protein [candidate division KSB1 bacterium]MDZ7285152.1 AtpZ/AtpI family protein [candidate division KSB1 bacterium]MDZ7298184.1 AtpZ/AtpI family protein [candidate division KSB1 bacterium]MDZ7307849.1 AtpZ/AtpI family protein [candidate division KSB1 bacterium]